MPSTQPPPFPSPPRPPLPPARSMTSPPPPHPSPAHAVLDGPRREHLGLPTPRAVPLPVSEPARRPPPLAGTLSHQLHHPPATPTSAWTLPTPTQISHLPVPPLYFIWLGAVETLLLTTTSAPRARPASAMTPTEPNTRPPTSTYTTLPPPTPTGGACETAVATGGTARGATYAALSTRAPPLTTALVGPTR